MINLLKKIFSPDKNTSRNRANDRLRVVLTHDRLGANSQLMETLQREIIAVIAKHMDIEGVPEVHLITEGRRTALDISIPIKGR
ncbi:MAG: cell division topological specificity factor MinE [Syntrophomonadaceae bacterium]|nr:cell division topological specificity factor MinE [Syntrophomonadaceae bacterium]